MTDREGAISSGLAGPSRLAVDTYADLRALDDAEGTLNLAWTSDERAWLAQDLDALMLHCLQTECAQGLPCLHSYRVQDPYGQAAIGGSARRAFSLGEDTAVFTGAGVGSLVQAMAGLARNAEVRVAGNVYPDFPYWVERMLGRPVASLGNAIPLGGVVFLEHPSLTSRGDAVSAIHALCRQAQAAESVVVVDESNANYIAPQDSIAGMIARFPNLIVLRGFSKAYGLGGLRLGLALCDIGLGARLRDHIAPLLASPLSLGIGAAVLDAGDIAAPLRARIAAVRAMVEPILDELPLPKPVLADPRLPYILFDGTASSAPEFFEARGIHGKFHRYWNSRRDGPDQYYRISLPLSDDRVNIFFTRAKSQ